MFHYHKNMALAYAMASAGLYTCQPLWLSKVKVGK